MSPCRSARSTRLDLVALEERVLGALAGATTSSTRPHGSARAPSRGSSTRARRPPTAAPASTTCGPASSRTSIPASRPCGASTSPRKGGWDCHGLPVEVEVEKELGLHNKHEIEDYGIAEFNQRCRESVHALRRGLVGAHRRDRHVDRHRRRLLDAVATTTSRSSGGCSARCGTRACIYEGYKVVALLRPLRHRAVEPRARPARRVPGRHRPVGLRALPASGRPPTSTSSCGRRRRGRSSRTSPPRSGPTSTTCASRGPDGGRDLVLAERPRRPACSATTPRSSARSPVDELVGWRYQRPFDRPAARRRRRARSSPPTSSPPTTARASCTSRPRSARSTARSAEPRACRCSTRSTPTARSTRPVPPLRGPVREGRRPRRSSTTSPRAGLLVRRGAVRALATRTAGAAARRSSTGPRPSWFARTSEQRDELLRENETHRLAPRAHQARPLRRLAREQRRLGALARPLLGHAAPVWRCDDCGHDTCIGSVAELVASSPAATSPTSTCTARTSTTSRFRCPTTVRRHGAPAASPGARRVVRLGLDAVGAVPLPVRERRRSSRRRSRPTSSARRSTRRAAGSTRCSRSTRSCSTRRRTATSCASALHRRRGRPEDVEVAGQRHRPVDDASTTHGADALRWYFFSAGQPWTPRRVSDEGIGEADPQDAPHALEHLLVLRHLRRPRRLDARRRADAAARRTCSTGGSSASSHDTVARGHRRARALRRAHRGAHALGAFVDDLSNWYVRRSRPRFWKARDPRPTRRCTECLVTTRAAARAVLPVPRRRDLHRAHRRALGAPRRLARAAAPQRPDARRRDAGRARRLVAARPRRPHRGQGRRCASRCAGRCCCTRAPSSTTTCAPRSPTSST